MSGQAWMHVVCDWPRCRARHETGYRLLVDARKDAAERAGWSTVAGMDFCGPAERVEWTTPEPWPPKDHAATVAKGEHRPTFKHATTGGTSTRAGCSCGWVHNWVSTSRRYAAEAWVYNHIRPDVVNAARPTEATPWST